MIGLHQVRRKLIANRRISLHGNSYPVPRARLPLHTLVVCVFLLLLQGCAGFFTSHPVADLETSVIDQRLLGSWKRSNAGKKPSWIASFSSKDKVTGKLVLLRYDWKLSEFVETNALSVRCLREGDTGVCSAKLDDNPIPAVKISSPGFTFNFSSMREAPKDNRMHVVAYYEISQSGAVAVYADTDSEKLKLLAAEENIASISKESTDGLMRFLSGRAKTLFKKKPTLMRHIGEETLDEKLARLKKELASASRLSYGSHYAYNAAMQLGGLGKQAASAVPDLTEIVWQWLDSEASVDEAVVRGTIVALGKIGVSTPEILAAMEAARKFGNKELRQQIDKTLEVLEREEVK